MDRSRLLIVILSLFCCCAFSLAELISRPGRVQRLPSSSGPAYWTDYSYVGKWEMETTNSAGNMLDTSGNGIVATNFGTAKITVGTNAAGRVEYGRNWAAGTEYVSCGSSTSLNPNVWTIALWFYPYTLTSGQRLISRESGDQTTPYAVFVHTDNKSITLWTAVNSPNAYTYVQSARYTTNNVWTHFAATLDGTNLVMYLDGKLQGSAAWTRTPYQNAIPTFIGATYYANTPQCFFKGIIDEVRIAARAFSSNEVYTLYQNNLLPNSNNVYRAP